MSQVLDHYKVLHAMPEVGFEEKETSSYIIKVLKDAGYADIENIKGTTGVVAKLDSGKPGPTLALRADIDALGHIIEGKHTAMHTCGHDAHTSIALTTAQHVIQEGIIKKGCLKFIFQPAEELGLGALSMIKGGAVDDVDILIGLHLRPKDECPKGFATPAMYYSASTTIEADFEGVPAHGARPHLGVNALDAACLAIQAVNTIHLNPSLSFSAKATRCICDAGVTNAIPAKSHVCWDLRTPTNQAMDELKAKVIKAIECSAQSIGATVKAVVSKEIPAAEINDEVTQVIAGAIKEVLGESGLKAPIYTPGGEDFFNYPIHNKNIKAGFWGLGVDLLPGLHHPDMHFDLDSLHTGVNITKACVRRVLG